MITGKTSSGFEFSVSENLKTDFRFVAAYADTQSDSEGEQAKGLVQLLNVVLGKKGAAALQRHVALEDGTVPIKKLMAELGEIIRATSESDGAVKN